MEEAKKNQEDNTGVQNPDHGNGREQHETSDAARQAAEREKAEAYLRRMMEDAERRSKKAPLGMEFFKGTLFGFMLASICGMALVLISTGTIGFPAGNGRENGADKLTSGQTISKLREIRDRIEDSFLYEEDGELLTTYLFKGLTVGLEDPYASYYTADEVETLRELNEGEYHGIGINVFTNIQTGRFQIESVYENSPADLAGLREGDEILAVDGETVEGMALSELVSLIKQKDDVDFRIARDGKELEVSVEVTEVEIPTVSWEILDDNIGYLKITEFDRITVAQFEEAMKNMKAQGVERLILDVRDNPGGVLEAVCDILDDLLPEGLIVYTEDKEGNREEYRSDADQIYNGALAVLVNGDSASASEIFAGSIQDYGLGPVIGTTTYGKGVVQRTYPLNDGSALKLTVEKYYTAGGQDIHGNGIAPDYVVENGEAQREQAAETRTEAETGQAVKSGDQDRQLQRAIEYLTEEENGEGA